MGIVDAHHHLWNPDTNDPEVGYVWLKKKGAKKPFGDPTSIQRDYLLDEFLGEYEIEGSVHIQSDGGIEDPVKETAFVQGLADGKGVALAIVGFVDLAREDAERVIEGHKRYDRFCGVRQILSRIEGRGDISFTKEDYMRDGRWCEQFGLLRDHDLVFDLQLYPEQMRDASKFLSRYEEVSVVIDHAGSPYDMSEGGKKVWYEGLKGLSEQANVSVKMSGYGMYDREWRCYGYVMESLLELFGEDRVMFGSNYPVDKLMRGYGDMVEDLRRYGGRKFFVENAKRIYGL